TVAFNAAVTLASSLTVDSIAASFGSTVDGAVAGGAALAFKNTLIDSLGSLSLDGSVGATGALQSLSVTGTTTLGLNATAIDAVGGQAYSASVVLKSDPTLKSSTGGNITFSGPVDGPAPLTVATSGNITFFGFVGGTTPLASLSIVGGGITDVNGG